MSRVEITYEFIRSIVDYDEKTGLLYWKERPAHLFKASPGQRTQEQQANNWNSRWVGKEAMYSLDPTKHKRGLLFGHRLTTTRVIWLWMTGAWPKGHIDHKNGIPYDDRWDNLRDVPPIINNRNLKLFSTNTSGVTGVYWCKTKEKWKAGIGAGKKNTHSLGYYANFEDAVAARKEAEKELQYFNRSEIE